PVKVGDVICTVEGDKAVNEVEALDAGILRIPPDSPQPGAKVPVGTVLAYLVEPGEAAAFETAVSAARAGSTTESTATIRMAPPPTASATELPRVNRRGVPAISPRARRIAGELGVDWARLLGSGRDGRIVERDVRRAESQASEPTATPGFEPPEVAGRRVPLSGLRQTIARRLGESARATVPVTLTTEVDATALVRLRAQLKADLSETDLPVPSYVDLLAMLVSLALQEHPFMNCSLDGEEIVQHGRINLGIAVDTERGLIVPVIRDVPGLSILKLASESARLIEETRAGRIAPADLQGGTFTLSNLGMYDVDAFTPVINPPECAILGIGRIVTRPVVVDEEAETIAVRKMLTLSLTFDHRLVDGAPAARFLQRIKYLVEHPTVGLLR
ncbi:MAG TPA: dihydrolipoamide acetyltransferase family protein, partial [Chloroflexota bacterium]|nr:dihydrolipoamide acetyltransferase family protein [Chloroflexota bacterium]